MSLIKLTKNLENFKWTSYEKAGEGKSPQQDGTNYFERPNPKSLDGLESKFGQLDTQTDVRGPYGVSNVMDGEKQGRGFIPPGSTPSGFTKDMDLLHNKSEFEIGGDLTRTPLSYEMAGVTSTLSYGEVTKKELNLEPQAKGAYGTKVLPISTYTSRQPIEDIPFGEVGGSNTYYGSLEPLSSRTSKFQQPDGSYTTPEEPLFEGGQRTFIIPAAYPKNTTAYTIDTQIGWSYQNKFLESHGTAWRGFGLRTTLESQMDTATFSDVVPEWYPTPPTGAVQTPHPINKIYLNSEPNYGAPSSLEIQFLQNYGITNGIWPYKVLGFTGTHPLIRKDIGERYPAGGGLSDWIATQAQRTTEDFDRIQGWLGTPKGELWIGKQNILQELNPREETRQFSLDGVIASIPPFLHGKRHITAFGGETYMDIADFGPIFEGDKPDDGGGTFRSMLEGKFPKLVGPLNTLDTGMDKITAGLDKIGDSLGLIDFNGVGAGGRLKFLTDRFIWDGGPTDKTLFGFNLTKGLNNSSPFGRPPKIPTQYVKSQAGAYGGGDAHKNVVSSDPTKYNSVLQKYQTLAYGDLRIQQGYDKKGPEALLSPGERGGDGLDLAHDAKRFRLDGKDIVDSIGHQGLPLDPDIYEPVLDTEEDGANLGIIKKGPENKYQNQLTDRLNILPYGLDNIDDPDFIKFKFKDLVNGKFIVFRAILSGISDAISPEWSGTRYIGRPDQVYVYQGAERKVNFNFEIYPKTKQEFPVLMEKLNYLVGLCYPSFTEGNRMIAPFIELTLGDMFKNTPGFLDSLSIDVDDVSTWEIEDGLQFPKHITCTCSFTYVGKYLPSTLGKHYELDWLDDKGWNSSKDGAGATYGTFRAASEKDPGTEGKYPIKDRPERKGPMSNLFDKLKETRETNAESI
tara:strand:+ start:35 stop:2749 length:2715 start_codon:yes stop_codon:yes gene_type:complete